MEEVVCLEDHIGIESLDHAHSKESLRVVVWILCLLPCHLVDFLEIGSPSRDSLLVHVHPLHL